MRFFVLAVFCMNLTIASNEAAASLINARQDRVLRSIESPKGSGQIHFEMLCRTVERKSDGNYHGVWKRCHQYGVYPQKALTDHMAEVGYDPKTGEELLAQLDRMEGRTDVVTASTITGAVISAPVFAVGFLGFLAADLQISNLKNKIIRDVHPFHLLSLTGQDKRYFLNFFEFEKLLVESLNDLLERQGQPPSRQGLKDIEESL